MSTIVPSQERSRVLAEVAKVSTGEELARLLKLDVPSPSCAYAITGEQGGVVEIGPARCDQRAALAQGAVGTVYRLECTEGGSRVLKSSKYSAGFTLLKSKSRSYNLDMVAFEAMIRTDEFVNETIVSYILNEIAPAISVRQDLAFACADGKGYSLYEKADMDLSTYVRNMVKTDPAAIAAFHRMLVSLLQGLLSLERDYDFVHGDLKAKNVLVWASDPPVAKLADFGKSSITYKNVRFQTPGKFPLLVGRMPDPAPVQRRDDPAGHSEWIYTCPRVPKVVAGYARHFPAVYYRNLDFYTLFVSICLEPGMLELVGVMAPVWQRMWPKTKQRERVQRRIIREAQGEKPQSITTAYRVLRGLDLQYF